MIDEESCLLWKNLSCQALVQRCEMPILASYLQGERSPVPAASPQRGTTASPLRPGSSGGCGDRLTRRALSLGGGGDSKVIQTSVWLDDLRQRFGRPQPAGELSSGELENLPPLPPAAPASGGKAGVTARAAAVEPSPPRRAPDAAVLAAALAARLQASPSERLYR